jgi:Holliday junction DNA helicase RuvA
MISYLFGILSHKEPLSAIIDCNGVGYEVNIPLSTYDKLPELGKQIKLTIHYSFNETDGVRLYGFISRDEKILFRRLITISKIGPKLALAILSGLSVQDMIRAVQTGDVNLISSIPGIGKKTAERLIIELKDKVSSISAADFVDTPDELGRIIAEAEAALVSLGYKQFEVRKTINDLIKKHKFTSSEEIVKSTIQALYKQRKI